MNILLIGSNDLTNFEFTSANVIDATSDIQSLNDIDWGFVSNAVGGKSIDGVIAVLGSNDIGADGFSYQLTDTVPVLVSEGDAVKSAAIDMVETLGGTFVETNVTYGDERPAYYEPPLVDSEMVTHLA